MREIKVGLIGFGTVGKGLAEVLLTQKERLIRRTGMSIRLAGVADHSTAALPDRFSSVSLTKNAADLITDPDIDVIVELIGGIEPAKTFVMQAIAAGKHVVTANKALLSEEGAEIFAAAAARGVEVGFEASVGGGIPVIKALKEGLVANRILSIMGIMNGTANYILTRMTDEGIPFAEVLQDAQRLGFAEADPTYDIEGIDTAHKLAILMTIAYGTPITHKQIVTEGISQIEPMDIELAREFGCRIKLLAISRNHGDHVEARVHPTMVPQQHLLASINGAYNAIHFQGDTVGNVLLYGLGAGMIPTGSAVAADLVDIARNIACGSIGRVPALSYLPDQMQSRRITPMDELYGPYYFRCTVLDQPGVLASIAGILAKYEISIESVLQKGRKSAGAVPLVVVTHSARESAIRGALDEIGRLEAVTAPVVKIRILEEE
ncbi:homoserine dehydrogenase [Desulfobulbus oligotrophicus]|uniref:Homoserine dehydrogenase n=1 Tax=Desulfobulbus oligotrophicus TaxID=1909699 RepID=A0A7T5VAS7_9BACT|nr:homoserine dehydrogenase [Desulfobulbus oligotrophicus]MDY0390848.1 homoserine dehydrogenase [Desulfobulbus oligotrophicus]QQG64455.1 homoserine dehydrogenase [Desulfobulbus oligotrophicus]